MKKLLFIVVALFTTYYAQAQEGLKIGLKAGGNFSGVTGFKEEEVDPESIFGFHVGAFLDFGISEMVSIRPELLYSTKGFKLEGEEDDFEIQFTQRLHYLEVPILARIKAGGLFFELGPTLGYQIGSSSELKVDGKDMDLDDDDDRFKKFEFGYAAGLGYQFGGGLGLGLRYQGGLTSINDDDDDDKIKNSVIQLSLSYMLGGR